MDVQIGELVFPPPTSYFPLPTSYLGQRVGMVFRRVGLEEDEPALGTGASFKDNAFRPSPPSLGRDSTNDGNVRQTPARAEGGPRVNPQFGVIRASLRPSVFLSVLPGALKRGLGRGA